MTHHPHVHGIVPGGGISLDGSSWVRCRPGFLLPVRVLAKLFRRLMLDKLAAAHAAGKLWFFVEHARLGDAGAFAGFLAPLRTTRWFVDSKRPFAGPQAVLAYIARYTHRVAISNRRLLAADPKHLGARIGITAVLHSWGSAMTRHPHVHMIVPGGGISLDGSSWARCRPGFLLPVRVLAKLFRRLMLAQLAAAHAAGKLQLFGQHAHLADADAFAAFLVPLRTTRWFVYCKRPFAGPQAVLAYLSRYTHRVAISNRRLVALDADGVTFRYKDYRRNGQERYRTMTLVPGEFIRRFLLHVLPKGFHRIRHYGLLASAARKANLARARELLAAPEPPLERDQTTRAAAAPTDHRPPCPCCGGRMIVVETFERGGGPRDPPSSEPGIRTAAA
jgi:hypothetical protein